MKNQTDYNKIVNFDKENGEIEVLDYTFDHGTFKGATGSRFDIITKSQYDDIMEEYLSNPSAVSEYWHDATGEYLSYDDTIAISESEDEIIRLCGGLDDSYRELWDYLREELKLSKQEAYMFNCSGGGRMFDKDYQGNYNEELSEEIRKFES